MSETVKKREEREAHKETWDALTSHVKTGEEALKLLEAVYLELGPYRNREITEKTWDKVRNFFGFDDSE